MGQDKIKILLELDHFAKKMDNLDKESRHDVTYRTIMFCKKIKRELLDTKKISKITYNRFRRGLYAMVFATDYLMREEKFNDLFDIPEVDLQLFNNSWKKIKKELECP